MVSLREKSTWANTGSANDRSSFRGHVGFVKIFFKESIDRPTSTNQKPRIGTFREAKGRVVGWIDAKKLPKIERKIESVPLRPAASTVSFNGPLGRLTRSGLALSRARHALALGLRRGKKKRGGNFSLGVSSQPAPADVEPHNTPRRCARVHRVTGFFAEASNERTNARYPPAHGSAGRRRGPGARANPIAAVGGTPPRLRRR